eukprot:COSAG02_NODE_1484_length_12382_cov_6.377758_1_plen_52_part_10
MTKAVPASSVPVCLDICSHKRITEKLHLWEQTKATVFVVANVFTALFGLVCS